MKSDKKTQGSKKDNDLKFTPLDIKEPFKFNNSTLSPIIQYDGTSISASSSDIFVGFQPLTNIFDRPLNDNSQDLLMPLMPYPISTPSFEASDINSNSSTSDFSGLVEKDLSYSTEVDQNDLYSYNKARGSEDYLNNIINPIDILRNFDLQEDIIEDDKRGEHTTSDIDEIFKAIQENNQSILGTLKIYRIPYPIAKLLVKKIIKLTLDYKKGR